VVVVADGMVVVTKAVYVCVWLAGVQLGCIGSAIRRDLDISRIWPVVGFLTIWTILLQE
jgi:hypothetical protein